MPNFKYDKESGAFEVFPTGEEKVIGTNSDRLKKLIYLLKEKKVLSESDLSYLLEESE